MVNYLKLKNLAIKSGIYDILYTEIYISYINISFN